jgi:hypothetical protein
LLIVPETELLGQVALEEDVLRERLEKVVVKLKTAKTTMDAQLPILKAAAPDTDYSLVVLRTAEVRNALLDTSSSTREIFTDFSRILRELEVNNVRGDKISDLKKKIVGPLENIVHPTLGGFALTQDVAERLYSALDEDVTAGQIGKNIAKHAQTAMQTSDQLGYLIRDLEAVLDAINQGIDFAQILERAIAMERDQTALVRPLQLYHDQEVERLLNLILNPKK